MVEKIIPQLDQLLLLFSPHVFYAGIRIGMKIGERIHGKPIKELTRETRLEQIFYQELRIVEGR